MDFEDRTDTWSEFDKATGPLVDLNDWVGTRGVLRSLSALAKIVKEEQKDCRGKDQTPQHLPFLNAISSSKTIYIFS
jgi:hypothetical protein